MGASDHVLPLSGVLGNRVLSTPVMGTSSKAYVNKHMQSASHGPRASNTMDCCQLYWQSLCGSFNYEFIGDGFLVSLIQWRLGLFKITGMFLCFSSSLFWHLVSHSSFTSLSTSTTSTYRLQCFTDKTRHPVSQISACVQSFIPVPYLVFGL